MIVTVIGIEPVDYVNYVGKRVKGCNVSFSTPLESPNLGVRAYRHWLTESKIKEPFVLGDTYEATFEEGNYGKDVLVNLVPVVFNRG